jgi:hypothetical protein
VEKQNKDLTLVRAEFVFFGGAAAFWLFLIEVVGYFFSDSGAVARQIDQAFWGFYLWGLCVLEFFVLRMLFQAIFQRVNLNGRATGPFSRRIFFWGFFKVVCLGLFLQVLLKGQKIPLEALMMGFGTLAFVPLVGGFFFSRWEMKRELNNA